MLEAQNGEASYIWLEQRTAVSKGTASPISLIGWAVSLDGIVSEILTIGICPSILSSASPTGISYGYSTDRALWGNLDEGRRAHKAIATTVHAPKRKLRKEMVSWQWAVQEAVECL